MLILNESVPSYEDVKNSTFDKYKRKVAAIISNIDQNSLKSSDKMKLKNMLAKMLVDI